MAFLFSCESCANELAQKLIGENFTAYSLYLIALPPMGKISLEGLEFHAYHGVYPHERDSGNWFEVDIEVEADFTQGATTDELAGTVNYETLFEIAKAEMEIPSKLLETVAAKIVDRVLAELKSVQFVTVKISKLNPPIGGKCKKASISIDRGR
jgi:7,8-dihydroneopterin aldolase/epimerase/oxygenase